jgi:nicotinate-nucleotide--dimethylbenzimidazole phosphoribosyltransferase
MKKKTEENISEVISRIRPSDREIVKRIVVRLNQLTKPPGSLGRLEELAIWYTAISGKLQNNVQKKTIVTFAGDHGVADESVSAYPKSVTAQMVYNFLNGGAAVNILAKHVNAEVRVVDMGVDHDFNNLAGLIHRKVARGTQNIASGPAMTREQAFECVAIGIGLADDLAADGVSILGTGDMGIANTTSSSAIVSVMTGQSVRRVTGRGTGLNEAAWEHKVKVIERAIAINRPESNDSFDVLAKIGGFEIGGIAGLIIGSASHGIPVVLDGFISTAGALIAVGLQPDIKDYLCAAHRSAEPGHAVALEHLKLKPLLELEMRLGEGTGAALGIGLVEAAVRILNEMATFEEAGVANRPS